MPLFRPILAGATWHDRLIACAGAGLGIALTGAVAALMAGHAPGAMLLVGPIGASAVLVFAVPASPMAQPWPVLGGNVLSAAAGVIVAWLVREPVLASGLAVGLAILLMSLTRSLHPPGGAAALTAVLAGPATGVAGWLFPLVPVGLDALLLVGAGLLFHRWSGHSWPHRPAAAAAAPGFIHADLDQALADLHENFDIDPHDVEALLRQVEIRAAQRRADEKGRPVGRPFRKPVV